MWSHFTAWSERWAAREADLRYIPDQNVDGIYEAGAGTNMMQALATGQGWLVDEDKLRRLIQLSVSPQQRQAAEHWLQSWQARPRIIEFIPSGKGVFQVVQYQANSLQAAEEKLLQFPGGTVFQWRGDVQHDGVEKAAFQELSGFATQHGIKMAQSGQ